MTWFSHDVPAVGDIVFRGYGKVRYRVTAVVAHPVGRGARVWLERVDARPILGGNVFHSSELRKEQAR